MSDLDPLALLVEDLSQPDIELAIQSIRRIKTVALALGPDATRARLIPFLVSYGNFDAALDGELKPEKVVSDECLTEIAQQLADFVPLVGGKTNVTELVGFMENLATSSETCIRNATVESFAKVIPALGEGETGIDDLFVPMIKRLTVDESFASRCSACGIIPLVYEYLKDDANKAFVRGTFISLCAEETPLVRKAAFENCGKLAVKVGSDICKTEIGPVLRRIKAETQENIRQLVVEATIQLSAGYADDDFKEHVYPVIQIAHKDPSWRIRRHFARNFAELCSNSGKSVTGSILLPIYLDLLKDTENEVRLASVKNLAKVAENSVPEAFADLFGSTLTALTVDAHQPSKVAFADVVLDLCPSLGKAITLKVLIPQILKLVDDDVPDIRLTMLEKLQMLVDVIGVEEVVSNFLPKITLMTNDKRWRVRKSVVESVSMLANNIGVDSFNSKFKELLFEGLKDKVSAVRQSAAKQIAVLMKAFGADWFVKLIAPELNTTFSGGKSYLKRMVPVMVAQEILLTVNEIPKEVLVSTLIPIVQAGVKDSIANVRVLALKTAAATKRFDRSITGPISALLPEIAALPDPDVKYFAGRAIAALT